MTLLPTPRTSDTNGAGAHGQGGPDLRTVVDLLPTPRATDGTKGGPNQRGSSGDLMLPSVIHSPRWGDYSPAIARWENVTGRPAPAPTEPGARGGHRLSPRFVEWLMGLPDGHVTGVPGITRNQALKALGNGVVPQQCAAALRAYIRDETRAGRMTTPEVDTDALVSWHGEPAPWPVVSGKWLARRLGVSEAYLQGFMNQGSLRGVKLLHPSQVGVPDADSDYYFNRDDAERIVALVSAP